MRRLGEYTRGTLLSCVFLLGTMVACGHAATSSRGVLPAPVKSTNSTATDVAAIRRIDAATAARLLDPALSSTERSIVARAITGLRTTSTMAIDPANIQIAVFDPASNNVYYNRATLHGSFVRKINSYAFQPRPAGVESPAAGKRRTATYLGTGRPDAGTGPYRRLYTFPNIDPNAYSLALIIANVSHACNSGNLLNPFYPDKDIHKEAGHSYLGGWSGTNNAVDAGMIYNRGITTASQDDYSPFFAISGISGYPGVEYLNNSPSNFHIACGTSLATMSFYVDAPVQSFEGQIELVLSIVFNDGQPRQIMLVYQTGASYVDGTSNWMGWGPSCNNCVLKRTTSLAQSGDNFNIADYYTATWSSTQLSCGFFVFPGCQPGPPGGASAISAATIKACEEYPSWYVPYDDNTRDCSNMPANAVPQVAVENFSFDRSGEVDIINLTPVPVSPPPATPTPAPTSAPYYLNYALDEYVAADGLHVGANVSNNGNATYPVVSTRSIEFPTTGTAEFQIYDPNTVGPPLWDSWNGARFNQTLTWLTWAPKETKHFEAVWSGYIPSKVYAFNFLLTPQGAAPVTFGSTPFTPSSLVQVPAQTISTPIYSSCTLDSYGYCISSRMSNVKGVPCGRLKEFLGSVYYTITGKNGAVYFFTSTLLDDGSGTCATIPEWDPGDPAVALGDPNLP